MNMGQIGSMIVMMIMFALVLYGSYYCSKKVAKISMRENHSKYMKLEDRLMVGQDKHVAIVSVGGRYLMIGISSSEITVLKELQPEDLVLVGNPQSTFPPGAAFKDILKSLGRNKDSED